MASTSKLEFLFFVCFIFSNNIFLQGVLSVGTTCADTCSMCMNGGQCASVGTSCTWDSSSSSCQAGGGGGNEACGDATGFSCTSPAVGPRA